MMVETNQSEAYNLRYERSIAGLVKENKGGGACGVCPVRALAPDNATAPACDSG
jgi:hypothetical protein